MCFVAGMTGLTVRARAPTHKRTGIPSHSALIVIRDLMLARNKSQSKEQVVVG